MRKLLYLFCFVCLTHMALYGQSKGTLQLEQIRSFTFSNKGNVEFLTFNKRGNRIASVGYGHVINIWDANSGNLIQSLQGHEDIINHLVFNKDGNQLASASTDGTIKLWNLETAREIQSFKNPIHFKQKAAYFVVFSPDEKHLFFGGKNAKLSRAEIGNKALPEVLFLGKYHTTSASLSPDQKTMVFACGNRLHFLNFATGEIEESAANGGDYINDIKFSHDGKTLGGWSQEGSLRFWKYPNHKENWHIPAGDRDYSYISFSADDQLIAHGNAGNMFKIWNVKEQKLELVAAGHQGKVKTLAFSPNGKYIASGGYDGKVILWALTHTPKEEPKEEEPEPVVEERKVTITPPKIYTTSITPPKISTPKPPVKKPLPKKPEPKIEIAKEIPKPEPKVEVMAEAPKPEPEVEVVKETPEPEPKVEVVKETPKPKIKEVIVKKAKPAYAIDLNEDGFIKSINNRRIKLVGSINVSGNQIVLDTWDDGVVDGDKISVFLNSECILDKYELSADKKRISGQINPAIDNYIIVYAYNVGPKAPAIAALAKEGAEESEKIRMTADYRYCEALKIVVE